MEIYPPPSDAPARPDAPLDRSEYTLTVDEAVELYKLAGVARPKRRIQKYCARGDLVAIKVEIANGQFMITRSSIEVHIAHLKQEQAAALGRVGARRGASLDASDSSSLFEAGRAAPPADAPALGRVGARPDAPERAAPNDFQGRYLSHLETENVFLREQNTVLLERVKETNIITAKLQSMLSPFLGLRGQRSSSDDRQEGNTDEDHPKF
jgi:hypothetical protein